MNATSFAMPGRAGPTPAVRGAAIACLAAGLSLSCSALAQAPGAGRAKPTAPAPAMSTVRIATPETALAAAQAALAACRAAGFQAAVAVVDRSGVVQVLLRDRLAGPHTVEAAIRKAWTSASFRISTEELAAQTQPGRPMSGLRSLPQVMASGGGLPIEAAGAVIGGIGVSGAPGGDADERCAKAGIAAVADALELSAD